MMSRGTLKIIFISGSILCGLALIWMLAAAIDNSHHEKLNKEKLRSEALLSEKLQLEKSLVKKTREMEAMALTNNDLNEKWLDTNNKNIAVKKMLEKFKGVVIIQRQQVLEQKREIDCIKNRLASLQDSNRSLSLLERQLRDSLQLLLKQKDRLTSKIENELKLQELRAQNLHE
jgi:hypothetical protein